MPAGCDVNKLTPECFVQMIGKNILDPIMYVLFAAAMIVFMYGVIEFLVDLSKGGKDPDNKGKKHMLWGLIGLFIMLTAASIIGLVVNTFFPDTWPPKSGSSDYLYM